jgi:hypothetical protein
MKYFLALILSLTLTACGKDHTPQLSIQGQYQPYVDAFQARSKMAGHSIQITDLIIQSVDSIEEKYVVAKCLGNNGSTPPTIVVSQQYWTHLDVFYREELIFHEMGHCVLNRSHRTDVNNNLPLSIMNPYIFAGDGYTTNYSQYMHELFFSNDLASALPLQAHNSDPAYSNLVNSYFTSYADDRNTTSAAMVSNAEVQDNTAPETTTLSSEEISKLGCGHD